MSTRLPIYNGSRRVIIAIVIYTPLRGVRCVGGFGQRGLAVSHGDSRPRVYECPDTIGNRGYKAVSTGSDSFFRHTCRRSMNGTAGVKTKELSRATSVSWDEIWCLRTRRRSSKGGGFVWRSSSQNGYLASLLRTSKTRKKLCPTTFQCCKHDAQYACINAVSAARS